MTPAAYGDLVLFGSEDGWVTCLEAASGELVWRFRAAPERRKILCYNRLVSAWPVNSGVLVDNNVAYFTAGRCSLDGAYAYAVEPRTGKLLWQNSSLGFRPGREIYFPAGPKAKGAILPKEFPRAGLNSVSVSAVQGTPSRGEIGDVVVHQDAGIDRPGGNEPIVAKDLSSFGRRAESPDQLSARRLKTRNPAILGAEQDQIPVSGGRHRNGAACRVCAKVIPGLGVEAMDLVIAGSDEKLSAGNSWKRIFIFPALKRSTN